MINATFISRYENALKQRILKIQQLCRKSNSASCNRVTIAQHWLKPMIDRSLYLDASGELREVEECRIDDRFRSN